MVTKVHMRIGEIARDYYAKRGESAVGRIPERGLVNGVLENPKTIWMDPEQTIGVGQRGYAFGSARIDGTRYLASDGIYSCVVVIAYNTARQVAVLAHLDYRTENIIEAVSMARKINAKEMVIFGGSGRIGRRNVATIEGFLIRGSCGIEIAGRDLLREVERDQSKRQQWQRGTSIGIDTATGQIAIPEAGIDIPHYDLGRFSNPYLRYDGSHIVPREAFFEEARRVALNRQYRS